MLSKAIRGWIVLVGICWFSCSSTMAGAQEATVHLKDGSVLKGTILSRQDNFVRLRGTAVGDVWINKNDIVSIQEDTTPVPAGAPTPAPTYTPPPAASAGPSSEQFEKYQEKITKDPQMMASIQALASNKDIQDIVSDPSLREAIMRNDIASLQNNPKFQKFMENPDVQKIVGNVTADDQGAQNVR